MRKSLLLLTVAFLFIITQGITTSTSHAQRLLKKLYDDKETVRGGQKEITTSSEAENEYFYRDKSGKVPRSGYCYIQYYHGHAPERATIIINNKVTADVLLAGIDTMKYNYKSDVYWEVYNHFIFRKQRLRYRVVGQRKGDGMHRIVLYAGRVNINNWINKYCRVRYLPKPSYKGPVWIHGRGNRWSQDRWRKGYSRQR